MAGSAAVWPGVVDVVVVTYNNEADIEACLRTLLDAAPTIDLRLHVVDNASTDATLERLRAAASTSDRLAACLRVTANTENAGFGRACNQGAAVGEAPVVVLLNPDTECQAGVIDALVAQLARDPSAGPVGGRTVDAEGEQDPRSVQRGPTLGAQLAWAVGAPVWARRVAPLRRWAINPELYPVASLLVARPVDVVVGCLLALRREHWQLLGGFDERYFLYCEDVDLSLRAARAGLQPTYTPDAGVMHAWGASSQTVGHKIVAIMRGRATLFRQHWSPGRARLGIWLLGVGVGVRAAGERLSGHRGAWCDAYGARQEWREGYPLSDLPAQSSGSAR